MEHERLPNFVRAIFFHTLLLAVAFGTVMQDFFVETLRWVDIIASACSIVFYLVIPVATQFPHLLFINSGLRTVARYQSVVRLRFIAGVLGFWTLMAVTFCVQMVWGSDGDPVKHGIARWTLLVALAVFFSAFDYAIPSYRRYLLLSECGSWGPRARVFRKSGSDSN